MNNAATVIMTIIYVAYITCCALIFGRSTAVPGDAMMPRSNDDASKTEVSITGEGRFYIPVGHFISRHAGDPSRQRIRPESPART